MAGAIALAAGLTANSGSSHADEGRGDGVALAGQVAAKMAGEVPAEMAGQIAADDTPARGDEPRFGRSRIEIPAAGVNEPASTESSRTAIGNVWGVASRAEREARALAAAESSIPARVDALPPPVRSGGTAIPASTSGTSDGPGVHPGEAHNRSAQVERRGAARAGQQADDVRRMALSTLAIHAARAMGRDTARVIGLDGLEPVVALEPPVRVRPVAFHSVPHGVPLQEARVPSRWGPRHADVDGRGGGGRLSSAYDELIDDVARQHDVAPHLVRAVIKVESNFQPHARSPKGAIGLMQVMPATGRRFGATDLRDPRINVSAGTRYLRWLLNRFDDDLTLALAAYNAGEGAVEKHGRRVPPYPETQGYVRKVLDHLGLQGNAPQLEADSSREGEPPTRPRTAAPAPRGATEMSRTKTDGALQRVSSWFGAILTSGSSRKDSADMPELQDVTPEPRITSWPAASPGRLNGGGPV